MRLISFIIGLFLSVVSIAQQGTYTRIFSGPSYDEGIAVFRLPNKEIRLIGNTGSYGHGNTDVWLIALDSNGNFLWHKFYGGPNIEKVEDAVMTSSGDIFMVGSTTQNTSASYQVYFLGVDQYGQIISYNNYGGTNWEFGHGIDLISDTTFALVGETYSYGMGQSDVFVLKVNRQGDTLWTKTYGGLNEDRGNAIKLMPDKGLMIVGTTKSFGNGSFDSYMLRLQQDGDTVWTKVVSHISDAEYYSMAINPDTSMVCVGYMSDTLNTYHDVDLAKFDQNSNFKWSAASQLSEGEECNIKSIFREDNGDYIYCGITNKYSASQYSNIRVARISSAGWWQSSEAIGESMEEVGNAISLDDFNGKHYFLVGTTKSYDVKRSGIYFVRLDSNFNFDTTRLVDTPTQISQSTTSQLMKLYPNPAFDYLNLDMSNINEDGELCIFNLLGMLVKKIRIDANTSAFRISIANLESGAYLITYRSQEILLQRQFVKLNY